MKKAKFPNFLIVGSAKAATTSIHEYLKQHPDIFMSEPKEPTYFTFAGEKNIKFNLGQASFYTDQDKYLSLFKNVNGEKVVGESSTPYLYFYDKTISNIKKIHPDHENLKILILLRNPAKRAYSQYMMSVRDLRDEKPFYEALMSEEQRKKDLTHFDLYYLDRGLYYNQVKAYLDNFKNVKILFYEDFISSPQKVLTSILDFLELDTIDFKELPRFNASGVSKSKAVTKIVNQEMVVKKIFKVFFTKESRNRIKNKVMSYNLKKEDRFDIKSEKYLKEFYKEDIEKLELLLDKDLSNWYR